MFRIIKNESELSLFSPGFFFYKSGTLFLDEKAKMIFHLEYNKVSFNDFLCTLDKISGDLFYKILKVHSSLSPRFVNILPSSVGVICWAASDKALSGQQ